MKRYKIHYVTPQGDMYVDEVLAPTAINAIEYFYMVLHINEKVFVEKVEEI